MHYYKFVRSGAIALLLFMCSFVAACGGEQTSASTNEASGGQEKAAPADSEEMITVEAVRPEDILSEEERTGAPKYRDWYEESGSEPIQLPVGTSAGPIPAVKPFNFGRDPGGPEDKTLYLTVPKLGLEDVAVFDSIEEEKLKESAIHVPATGFPWQDGANVYIAGHRLGYPGTDSFLAFWDLNRVGVGDRIILTDADGKRYTYKVFKKFVVEPTRVSVTRPLEGRNIVTLQTCTLPDYSNRLIVQAEKVA